MFQYEEQANKNCVYDAEYIYISMYLYIERGVCIIYIITMFCFSHSLFNRKSYFLSVVCLVFFSLHTKNFSNRLDALNVLNGNVFFGKHLQIIICSSARSTLQHNIQKANKIFSHSYGKWWCLFLVHWI